MLNAAFQGTSNSLGHKENEKCLKRINLCNVSASGKWASVPQYHQPVSIPVALICQHHYCASGMNAEHCNPISLPLAIRNSPYLWKVLVRQICVEEKIREDQR